MLILLPPSETKRDGGEGPNLDSLLGSHHLSFPVLDPLRKKVVDAVVALAGNEKKCISALKLGPKQLGEIERNRQIFTSPTMPAIDRYTGVLYDALAPAELSSRARDFLASHVLIQSALLGPLGAMDHIPAYRLSFDSAVPHLKSSLKKVWSEPGSVALEQLISERNTVVLDLRSEGYSALSPTKPAENTFYLRVVTRNEKGETKALNHFNKKGKGEFVRLLAEHHDETSKISQLQDLVAWAQAQGIILEEGKPATNAAPAELNLVIS